jgi:hypothetical protein
MDKNNKTNTLQIRPKANKGALGSIFSVVLLDAMSLTLFMPRQAYIDRQFSKDNLNSV